MPSHRSSRRSRIWPTIDKLFNVRLLLTELEERSVPTTFTVSNTNDTGAGSLRQAILDANDTAGADTINFSIGSGTKTIAPTSELPTITEAVAIDATTQSGWTSAPIIELSGASAGPAANGFTIASSGSTIRGFVINQFAVTGVTITGAAATNNSLLGNYIGVGTDGSTALGNVTGVYIRNGATNNRIGSGAAGAGNVIAGNSVDVGIDSGSNFVQGNRISVNAGETAVIAPTFGYGLSVFGTATKTVIGTDSDGSTDATEGNIFGFASTAAILVQNSGGTPDSTVIAGNRIGLASNGTTLLNSGGVRGIWLDGASNTRIGSNADGNNDTNERNLIVPAANATSVLITDGSVNTTIAGNYFGLNPAGNVGLSGTAGYGITVQSTTTPITGTVIGGTSVAARNVLGSMLWGVTISGPGAAGTLVQGNYIGTDSTGTAAIENQNGVLIEDAATNITVGGTAAGARNVISGNQVGVTIDGANANVVLGNYIGLASDGLTALPNPQIGVSLSSTSASNSIGGTATGAKNFISSNGYGIAVTSSGIGNVVLGNVIGLNSADQIRGNTTAGITNNGGAGITIGGVTAAARNVISGNPDGVWLVASSNNTLLGNFIGTDSTGTAARPNTIGMVIESGSTNNTIGGVTVAARNVISGNSEDGINIGILTPGNIIQGNYIGTAVNGITALGNGQDGIITGSAVQIGGLTALPGTGAGNVISGNGNNPLNNFGNIYNGGAAGVVIQGNLIGLGADGSTVVRPTTQYGVRSFLSTGLTLGGVSTAARNIISGQGAYGLLLQGGSGHLIQNNFIGTDRTGSLDRGNIGVGVSTDASNTVFRGNVISGNDSNGMTISGTAPDATNIQVVGNVIGLNVAGTARLANAGQGLQILGATNVTVGGTTAVDRNIISGNLGTGVSISGGVGTTGVVVLGDYIGLGVDGSTSLGNDGAGVTVSGGVTGTVIGGTIAGATNVISGNTQYGVLIDGAVATRVQGNFIGTDKTGSFARANPIGVQISGSSTGSVIGGTAPGARNIISGNTSGTGAGVYVTDVGTIANTVAGNFIGMDVTGTAAVPNITGVLIDSGASNNIIGAPVGSNDTATSNTISSNTTGVQLANSAGLGNVVRLNRIFNNITNLQNALGTPSTPSLNLAVANPTTTRVRGSITGTPNASVTVDFYEANLGELAVRRFIGTTILTLDASGNASYDLNLPATTNPGAAITAAITSSAGTGNLGGPQAVLAPINVTINAPQTAPEGTEVTVTSRVSSDRLNAVFTFAWQVVKVGTPGIYARGSDASLLFTPDDDGVYQISLTVTDTTNNEAVTIVAPDLNVTNVVPFVSLINRDSGQPITTASLNVGSTLRLAASATDPGSIDQVSLTYQWLVNGVPAASGPTFDYTPTGSGDFFVSVRVTDKNGGSSGRAVSVTVLGPLTANIDVSRVNGIEGTELTANVRVLGATDTSRLGYNWRVTKNGATYLTSSSNASQQLPQISFTPDDNGQYRVTITVTDPLTGQSASAFSDITIANVAPTVTATRITATPALGAAVSLSATSRDPGTNSTNNDLVQLQWSVRGPIGFVPPAIGLGTTLQFTPTLPGSYFITVKATDKDNGTSSDTQQIDVNSGARSVTIGGLPAVAVLEGQSVPLTASVPGAAGLTFTYNWAITRNGDPFASGVGANYNLIPGRTGQYGVTVTARGSDGSIGVGTAVITANNAPPLASIAATPPTTLEGSVVEFVSTSRDPGGADVPLSLNWTVTGPGLPASGMTATGRTFRFTVPDDGTYTISLKASDPSGAFTTVTRTLSGQNAAPVVRIQNNGTAGGVTRLKAIATDAGPLDQQALSYQWAVNGTPVVGATSSTFSTTLGGLISVLVSDNRTTSSTVADVRILTAPGYFRVAPPAPGATQILVIGSSGNDEIDASSCTTPVVLDGGDGNDTLRGGSGDDVLLAGSGTNLIYGGEGNNRFIGGGNDTMIDGSGNGYFEVHFSTVSLDAGTGGIDTIDLSGVPFGITLDLTKNFGQPQSVNSTNSSTLALTGSFEQVIGTSQADVLTVGAGAVIDGGAGADRLTATGAGATLLGGNDPGDTLIADTGAINSLLIGGDGGTMFIVRASDATLLGGAGDDTVTLNVDAVRGLINAGAGNDTITAIGADGSTLLGGAGDDSVIASGNGLVVMGGDGTLDAQTANSGVDRLTLSGNNSTLIGGDGDDTLVFNLGTGSYIQGGDGNDSLFQNGGSGLTLSGGLDRDLLVIRNGDSSTLLGGDGDDTIVVTGGTNPLVSGGAGADQLTLAGVSGGSTLLGGSGDDTILINPTQGIAVPDPSGSNTTITPIVSGPIFVDAGSDRDFIRLDRGDNSTLLGGAGDDTVLFTGGSGLIVSGGSNADTIVAAGGGANSTLIGGDGDDTIIANPTVTLTVSSPSGLIAIPPATADGATLIGGDGDDTLIVGGGTGLIVVGGTGNDRLAVVGGTNTTLIGGSGDDNYQIGTPVTLQNVGGTLPGGDPTGTVVLAGDGQNLFNITSGTNSTLIGGAGDETYLITGGVGLVAVGNAGNDLFEVRGSTNSTLIGGAGDDDIAILGGTNIRADGNAGANEAVVSDGTGILVVGGSDNDKLAVIGGTGATLIGGSGDDTIFATGLGTVGAVLSGGDGNDRLVINPNTNSTLLGGTGDETIVGSVSGTADRVIVLGDLGNDRIVVGGGDGSTLIGGAGDDTIVMTGGTGVMANTGEGNDAIIITTRGDNSTLIGGSGDDTFYLSGATGVVVSGGDGKDTITLQGQGGTAYGDGDNDMLSIGRDTGITLLGGSADETILNPGSGTGGLLSGGAGDDQLTAVSGTGNILVGGDGNDTLINITADRTLLYGLAGDDFFDIRGGSDITALGDLSVFNFTGNDSILISGGTRVVAYGERGNDTLRVTNGTTVSLYGGSGNDLLRADGGSYVLLAGNGDNDVLIANSIHSTQLFGGLGNDRIATFGGAEDVLVGEEGDDRYQLSMPTGAGITLTLDEVRKLGDEEPFRDSYGFGTDILDLRTLTAGATLDLSRVAGKTATAADRQVISGTLAIVLFGVFDAVYGTPFADYIIGNDADNQLYGFDGNDTLIGAGGNDTLVGGNGSNQLFGGDGSDVYQFTSGAAGSDTISESIADVGIDILDFSPLTLGPGQDQISVGVTVILGFVGTQLAGPNRAYSIVGGVAIEGAIGTRFNDTLVGTAANDSLTGGDGNDSLIGDAGNDTLDGGAGDDTLLGGSGNDWYKLAPAGIERLTDTSGIDTLDFQYAAYGVTITLAQDAAQIQTVDAAGNRVQLSGTFERLLGSSFNDVLTGNAADNDIIGRNGLDLLSGGAGTDYLQGGFTQVVLLDFDTDTRVGEYQYTLAQRTAILTYLQNLYAPFGLEFTLSSTDASTRSARLGAQFTTIRFNAGQAGGSSDQIDARNVNPGGLSLVNAFDFIARYLPASNTPGSIDAAMTAVSGSIAAHELGHQLGLRHFDAFGPIGTGLYAGGLISPVNFVGDYVPPVNGSETGGHVMASPLSLGTPASTLLGTPYFGEREAIKLAFTQYGSASAEPVTAHRTVATAAPLILQPLIVPNTLRTGDTNAGPASAPNTFSAYAAVVSGRIDLDPVTGKSQNDYYAFAGRAGETYTFELSSTTIKRFAGKQLDPLLRLYNAAGIQIAWNDDDFESSDSLLLDVTLPADGTYYLVVDTYTDGITDSYTGRYELLAYRMVVGTETGRGDTLVGGSGSDTLVTGTGPDLVMIPGDGGQDKVVSGGARTLVDATKLPSYSSTLVTGPATIIGINHAPTFTTAPTKASVAEGGVLNLQYLAVDSDGGTRVRYELSNAPSGASIDATTGLFFWSPPDNGSYSFLVRALDPLGTAASVAVTITVTNVAPGVTLTGLPDSPVESSPLTLGVAVLDPSSVDTAAGFTYDWRIQLANTIITGNTPTVTFLPTNDGSYSLRIRVTDKDGAVTTINRSINVGNVAPTVTIMPSASTMNQGSTASFTALVSDPSMIDTAAGFVFTWKVNGVTLQKGLNQSQFNYTPRIAGNDTVSVSVSDGKDTTTQTFVLPVLNVAPTITALSVAPIRLEGSPISVTLTFTDPGSTISGGTETYTLRWTATGSSGQIQTGTVTSTGGVASFAFTPNDNGLYNLRAEIVENTATAAEDAIQLAGISVTNVAPTAAITGPASALLNESRNFVLTANDPSSVDQAASITFTIDWDGNGTVDQVVVGPSGTIVSHLFSAFAATTIRVTATDKDGGTSPTSSFSLIVAPISLIGGVLTVYGTNGNDELRVSKSSDGLSVFRNGTVYGTFANVTRIQVYAGGGDDLVYVDSDITIPAQLYGESGEDTLRGGAGNDTLDGGTGDDLLIAVTGDDLLLGGDGDDELRAGAGNDILDGGNGDDELRGASGNDLLRGGAGNDLLRGGSGRDFLLGGDGNDTLLAGTGDDLLYGEAGDDLLRGGSGSDTLDGGYGLGDVLRGGDGNDTITDPDGVLIVSGGSGNDFIAITFLVPPTTCLYPEAVIDGGEGDDTIVVNSQNANLQLELDGGAGDDSIELYGTWLNVEISGGSGFDRVKNRGVGLLELHGIELVE